MGVLDKIKKFFGSETQPAVQEQPAQPQPVVIGFCEYCQSDITETEPSRLLAGKRMHRKCAKLAFKDARGMMGV